jgi:hypothetical protein
MERIGHAWFCLMPRHCLACNCESQQINSHPVMVSLTILIALAQNAHNDESNRPVEDYEHNTAHDNDKIVYAISVILRSRRVTILLVIPTTTAYLMVQKKLYESHFSSTLRNSSMGMAS